VHTPRPYDDKFTLHTKHTTTQPNGLPGSSTGHALQSTQHAEDITAKRWQDQEPLQSCPVESSPRRIDALDLAGCRPQTHGHHDLKTSTQPTASTQHAARRTPRGPATPGALQGTACAMPMDAQLTAAALSSHNAHRLSHVRTAHEHGAPAWPRPTLPPRPTDADVHAYIGGSAILDGDHHRWAPTVPPPPPRGVEGGAHRRGQRRPEVCPEASRGVPKDALRVRAQRRAAPLERATHQSFTTDCFLTSCTSLSSFAAQLSVAAASFNAWSLSYLAAEVIIASSSSCF